ncbi:maleylpyruvate isomerase family mycothiol-dependent enzyme [Georgenia sp. EYE_87]|uniref:maleylpyruvate isomerase family mycothiol-dependent enzyme n=1 Tax=Georgenia sp. EYE_87 TaxID=2853448 RepID=UPI00200356F3|nr:maleylpyruvate isomerase family mycothiol-dependent enzyme [Georgenia sp. EYE_87]MCK6211609.1 maleylpyruvate isomerase family mycothiol-dependent enzyme [Georgenia sp. EYE_87]
MGASQIWAVVHAERAALAEDLRRLPAERWATPSLCPGWDVHDVLAHLVDDARTTRLSFVRGLLAAGLDFDRLNARGVARERTADPGRTLEAFRAVSGRTTSAPAPPATRLVEAFVHGEDIRRPLGIRRAYPADHVAVALRHQLRTSVKYGGGRERAQGLRLAATDTDLVLGVGEEVRGTAIALLLAVSGRRVSSKEFTGQGTLLRG